MAQLRPGTMGDKLDPSNAKPPDFADSLADAMDLAFHSLLVKDSMNRFEVDTNSPEARDRRRIFVAIAQGFVRHLTDNIKAFRVLDSMNVPTGETLDVQVDTTLLNWDKHGTPIP